MDSALVRVPTKVAWHLTTSFPFISARVPRRKEIRKQTFEDLMNNVSVGGVFLMFL
jgi:hypothetical protein